MTSFICFVWPQRIVLVRRVDEQRQLLPWGRRHHADRSPGEPGGGFPGRKLQNAAHCCGACALRTDAFWCALMRTNEQCCAILKLRLCCPLRISLCIHLCMYIKALQQVNKRKACLIYVTTGRHAGHSSCNSSSIHWKEVFIIISTSNFPPFFSRQIFVKIWVIPPKKSF